jgi:hypothetical protein
MCVCPLTLSTWIFTECDKNIMLLEGTFASLYFNSAKIVVRTVEVKIWGEKFVVVVVVAVVF